MQHICDSLTRGVYDVIRQTLKSHYHNTVQISLPTLVTPDHPLTAEWDEWDDCFSISACIALYREAHGNGKGSHVLL